MQDNRCGVQLTPEEYKNASVSRRKCNPGNIKGTDGKFLVFENYEKGFEYLLDYLTRAATGNHTAYDPEMTLREFFGVYAPTHDSNDPDHYAQFVADKIQVPVLTKIKDLV